MKRPASITESEFVPTRRILLVGGLGAVALGIIASKTHAFADAKPTGGMVTIENFDASGKSLGMVQVAKVVKSDADWRKLLSAESYDITRKAGTERAGSGK